MTAKSPKNTSAPKDNKSTALLFAAKVIKKLKKKETSVLAEEVLGLSKVVPGDPVKKVPGLLAVVSGETVKDAENTAPANTPRKNSSLVEKEKSPRLR